MVGGILRGLVIGFAAFAGIAYAATRATRDDEGGSDDAPSFPDVTPWGDAFTSWGDALQQFGSDALGAVMNATQYAMSATGLAGLQTFEGFSATPYWDHKGYSIGFGHLIKPGENLTYVTREQAAELLRVDLAESEDAVRSRVTVPLSQGQFDALTSFTYNLGAGAFGGSTLLRLLNAGDYEGAAAEFSRWVYASNTVQPALVARREAEKGWFTA